MRRFVRMGAESYAGHPLVALDGSPLGLVSVISRRPLTQLDRVEAMLKIFAVRAAAEVERLGASEALQRSEASYRAIFEASEDAIFIHDWDTGAVLDVNARACEIYGYSQEELRGTCAADTSSGVFPYTGEEALRLMQMTKRAIARHSNGNAATRTAACIGTRSGSSRP